MEPGLKGGEGKKSAGGEGAAVRRWAGRGAHALCGEQGEAGWGGGGGQDGAGEGPV